VTEEELEEIMVVIQSKIQNPKSKIQNPKSLQLTSSVYNDRVYTHTRPQAAVNFYPACKLVVN
jgi:hypothetical protein